MQKKIQLPKEQAVGPEDAIKRHTALDEDDVEGHRVPTKNPEPYSPHLPSTGGEMTPRLPSTGGELTGDEAIAKR